MPRIEIKTIAEVDVDIEMLAKCFAHLSDEDQAQFFIEVAKISDTWPGTGDMQWWYVGRHLRNCQCSTDSARDMIRGIAQAIEHEKAA